MDENDLEELRQRMERAVGEELSTDPLLRARQWAEISSVLYDAFSRLGLTATTVGGAAIEVHAPGVYRTGDIDLVLEGLPENRGRAAEVFEGLGFRHEGKYWRWGNEVLVDVVGNHMEDPVVEVHVHEHRFRAVRPEVLVRDRIVGFKHWKHTAYGHQAIALLEAFRGDLDMEWLETELLKEDSLDALRTLNSFVGTEKVASEEELRRSLARLHGKEGPQP